MKICKGCIFLGKGGRLAIASCVSGKVSLTRNLWRML